MKKDDLKEANRLLSIYEVLGGAGGNEISIHFGGTSLIKLDAKSKDKAELKFIKTLNDAAIAFRGNISKRLEAVGVEV